MANQTAAFLFTITITTLFLSLSSNASPMDCNNNDKQALLNIKEALGFPPYLFNWIPEKNCCSWSNLYCNDKGRIVSLSIGWDSNAAVLVPSTIGDLSALEALDISWSFYGTIPPSFTKLSQLQSLSIYGTKISGPIPDFGASTKLRQINLSLNKFSGPIPPFLATLRNLQYLYLHNNQLTGPLPPSLGILLNLQTLDLSNNQLTGPIPRSFGSLRNLVTLSLSGNQLNGSIPRGLFHRSRNGTSLYLYLAQNNLTGNVPEFLGNGNLQVLDASNNSLTGAAQFLSAPQMNYIYIDLSRNKLQFDFTNVTLSPNLSSLILDYNSVRGSIPESLNRVKQLWRFDLSNNKLCGEIPNSEVISRFGAEFFENNKCLCGKPLPPCTK